MVSKISPRSLEDEPRAGGPQKIEELQALLDINSAQTEKKRNSLTLRSKSFLYIYI